MIKRYEGMFLFDTTVAPDWEACHTELTRLMERIGARVVVATKWDERRLAYEIRGRKRGLYALVFFEAEATKIPDLERDARLCEALLRFMLLQANHLNDEEMKEIAARPSTASAVEAERIASRWGGGSGGGRSDGGSRGEGDGRKRFAPPDEASVATAIPDEPEE